MDQSIVYGINDLVGSQPGSRGGGTDTSMSADLDGRMPPGFGSMLTSVDTNTLIDGVERLYTPLNNGISHIAIPSGTVGMCLSGDVAAPLPADFGTSTFPIPGSSLAEFTKQKSWSQRVVDELSDFLHILSPDGRLMYLSPSAKRLTGYPPEKLLGKFIIDFIHPDDSGIFMREFNESIACGSPLQLFYRFRKRDGTYTIFECRGHPHITSETAAFGLNNTASVCGGYFMTARPYPTKNSALLDSFLEHKIENERLARRINDLKREEAEEAEEEQKQCQRKQGRRPDIALEEPNSNSGTSSTLKLSHLLTNPNVMETQPSTQILLMNSGIARQDVDNGNIDCRRTSLDSQAAHYDGITQFETIEMLTGLRYQDGERSHGISTGDQSATLLRGDSGIAMPMNMDPKVTVKKKKIKLPEDYVCTDCGTLDSPEWRKGPSGPKSLCNACGLRWAKKEKRKSFSSSVPLVVYSGPK